MLYNFAVVNRSLLRSLFLLFSAVLVGSCAPERDSERPAINILSPTDWSDVYTTQGIPLHVIFTDNGELLQYRMVIAGIDSLNSIMKDTTFRTVFIEGLSGKEYTLNESFVLATSVFNGYYTLILSCIDNEGNQALNDTVVMRIRNSADSLAPVIAVTGPTAGDTLGWGEGFYIGGSVTDETSLNLVSIRMGPVTGEPNYIREFTIIQDNAVNLDGITPWLAPDSTWTQGNYVLYVSAWDNHNGVDRTILFHVKY